MAQTKRQTTIIKYGCRSEKEAIIVIPPPPDLPDSAAPAGLPGIVPVLRTPPFRLRVRRKQFRSPAPIRGPVSRSAFPNGASYLRPAHFPRPCRLREPLESEASTRWK